MEFRIHENYKKYFFFHFCVMRLGLLESCSGTSLVMITYSFSSKNSNEKYLKTSLSTSVILFQFLFSIVVHGYEINWNLFKRTIIFMSCCQNTRNAQNFILARVQIKHKFNFADSFWQITFIEKTKLKISFDKYCKE